MARKKGDDEMEPDVVELQTKKKGGKPAKRTVRRASATRLKNLRCFDTVDEMVRSGQYIRAIATYIQEEAGECLDRSKEAVMRAVRRYRDTLEGAGIEIVSRDTNIAEEGDPYHELRVLEAMFNKQKDRIEMEVGTEESLKKLFSTTHREFEVLNLMGKDIIKMKKTLGLISSGGNRIRARATEASGRLDIARVIESPQSRHKVLSFIDTMIENPDLIDDLAEAKDQIALPETTEEEKPAPKAKKKKKKKATKKNPPSSRSKRISAAKKKIKKKKKK